MKNIRCAHSFVALLLLGLGLTLLPEQTYAQRGGRGGGGGFRGGGGGGRQMSRPQHQPRQSAPTFNRQSYQGNRPAQGNIGRGEINRSGNINRANMNTFNSRNTAIRRGNLSNYQGTPYSYGGRRYYAHRAYAYHPYRPHRWAGGWHPWGFFTGALAASAIAVSIGSDNYYYDDGSWYAPMDDGYTVVQAPLDGTIESLPADAQQITVDGVTLYYYGGAYYENTGSSYRVVAPPAGAVVDYIPEGAEEVQLGDQKYIKYGETYYQPIQIDGADKYEVVQVE